MGTTLTGTTPQDTYDSLIKVTDNGPISGTAKFLSDGLGNDSVLALSTTQVGVGASIPAITTAKLTVGGQLTNTANLALQLYKTGTPQILSGDVLGNIWFVGIDNDITTGTNNIGARVSAVATTNWTTDGTTSNTALTFHTHGTASGDAPERMRIDSTGNVGIGTAAPSVTFEVNGAVKFVDSSASGPDLSFGNVGGSTFINNIANARIYYGAFEHVFTNSDNSVESLNITSTGFLRMASGTGGIQFNGDTAAANALDDYEEGTWTMGVTFDGAAAGVTTSSNTGTYTKIGRQVTVNGFLALTSKGSSTGRAKITGLPFTIPNNVANYGAASLWFNAITFANQLLANGVINETTIELEEITEAGVRTGITDADFANNTSMIVNFTYFV
jgi:hypothetical protein